MKYKPYFENGKSERTGCKGNGRELLLSNKLLAFVIGPCKLKIIFEDERPLISHSQNFKSDGFCCKVTTNMNI